MHPATPPPSSLTWACRFLQVLEGVDKADAERLYKEFLREVGQTELHVSWPRGGWKAKGRKGGGGGRRRKGLVWLPREVEQEGRRPVAWMPVSGHPLPSTSMPPCCYVQHACVHRACSHDPCILRLRACAPAFTVALHAAVACCALQARKLRAICDANKREQSSYMAKQVELEDAIEQVRARLCAGWVGGRCTVCGECVVATGCRRVLGAAMAMGVGRHGREEAQGQGQGVCRRRHPGAE